MSAISICEIIVSFQTVLYVLYCSSLFAPILYLFIKHIYPAIFYNRIANPVIVKRHKCMSNVTASFNYTSNPLNYIWL